MNGPFQVAQLATGAPGASGKVSHTVRLQKPFGGQSVIVSLSYDGTVKADFSSIAKEKITLVHVGEKLIILFDNQSQVTLEPFFDSNGKPLGNVVVELEAGRDVTGTDFAALFPITDDQSVLPAAGGDGNAQATGANFSSVGVDPLALPNPLPLLGPEDLPNFVITAPLGPTTTVNGVSPTAGFTLSGTTVTHDETPGVQTLPANDMPGALPFAPPAGAGALIGWAETPISEIASSSASFGSGGAGTISYALTNAGGGAFAGADSGLRATATGNEIFLFTEGNLVVGREGSGTTPNANGAVAFAIYLDPNTLKLDVAQYEAISHPNAANPDDSTNVDLTVVHVTQTVTAADGSTASATSGEGLGIFFLDDGPSISVSAVQPEEGSAHVPALLLDESVGGDRGASGAPDGTVDDTGFTKPDPTGIHPIGELKTSAGAGNIPGELQALFNVVGDPGTDGEKSTTYAYSLSLTGAALNGGVATTLKVTDINGIYANDTIYLHKVSNTEVVGLVGNDPNVIALRITLANAGSLSGGQLVVDQYMALDHGADGNNFDSVQSLVLSGNGATLGVTLTATITDRDGDTAVSSATVGISDQESSSIGFQDDGPTISVAVVEPEEGSAHVPTLLLDESIGGDRGAAGAPNGTVDDTGFKTPDPTGTHPIGELKTDAGKGDIPGTLQSLFVISKDPGTDGEKSTTYAYSFALTGSGKGDDVATTLKVTDPNHLYADATIYLHQISATEIVGLVGDDPNVIALRITLANANSLSAGQLVVDQYMAIDHGADGNNFDSVQSLVLSGNGATLGVRLTATITDGDGDTATSSSTVALADQKTSSIGFQDDGPAISVIENSKFAVVHDETLLLQTPPFGDSNDILFTPVFNGVANPGQDPDVPFGLPIGYARSSGSALTITAVDFGTDGAAASKAEVYSLTLTDAGGKATTGPIDSGVKTTEGREIFLFVENGIIVGRYDVAGGDVTNGAGGAATDPAAFAIAINASTGIVSLVQYVSLFHHSADPQGDINEAVSLADVAGGVKATLTVTDGDGDTASASASIAADIRFEDDGPILKVDVPRNFGVTVDETPGNQSNDVTGPLTVFAGISNPGDDPDEPGAVLAYATSNGAALSVLPYFGVDGPSASNAVVYSLALNATSSGLKLTDGSTISLHLENDGNGHSWIVGRVDSGTFKDQAAFALAIDPSTGKVSVVEYLSLQHPNAADPNDGVTLAANAVSAVVTITDGDGDQVSAAKDISGRIHFNDDGPKAGIALTATTLTIDETAGQDVGSNDVANVATSPLKALFAAIAASPIEIAQSASSVVSGAASTYGADGPGSTTFSLKISANGVDSGLDATDGRSIFLYKEGALIVGREGTAGGMADANGAVAFAIALDSATGVLTVAEYTALHHANPLDPNEANSPLTLASNVVQAAVTVTDADGDTAVASVGIGSQIKFLDDGPSIAPPTNLIVNGSFEQGHDDLGSDQWSIYHALPGWTSVNQPGIGKVPFEVQVGLVGGLPAEDGNTKVELDSNLASGNLTGGDHVNDTGHTNAIIQQAVAGTVDGQTYILTFWYSPRSNEGNADSGSLNVLWNGQVVKTIDSTGVQPGWRQIVVLVTGTGNDTLAFQGTGQENTLGAFIDNVTLLAGAVVDEDGLPQGNHDSQPGDIVVPNVDGDNNEATTTGLLNISWGADNYNGGSDAFNASTGFTQDGSGRSVTFTSATLAALTGTLTSGTLTSHGAVVHTMLTDNGTHLVGYTGSVDAPHVVFEVSLSDDGTGKFDFILRDALDHASGGNENNIVLGFTYTATDSDGDTATGTFSVVVNDDMPVAGIALTATTLTIDETAGQDVGSNDVANVATSPLKALFAAIAASPIEIAQSASSVVSGAASTYGADGPGSTTFSLKISANGVDSGLDATDGRSIFLYKEGALIVGREGTAGGMADANGAVAFAIALDSATGVLTVAEYTALHHANPLDPNEANSPLTLASNVVQAAVTVTDADGDTAVASVGIGSQIKFLDDGPSIAPPTNLIVNGSFEQGHDDLGSDQWSIYHALPGWTSVNQPGIGKVPFEVQVGLVGGLPAEDGNTKVELDSNLASGNLTGGDHVNDTGHTNAIIQQAVAGTVDGQTYILTFWYSPRSNEGNADSGSLNVLWNGQVVKTIDSTGVQPGWRQIVVLVTGTGNDTLAFQGTGQENTLGAFIDNVTLLAGAVVDEDGLPQGNHDSQPGDIVVPNVDGDNNEATTTGLLNISWGADNYNGGSDAFNASTGFTQDGSGRSVTFTSATLAALTGTLTSGTLTSHGAVVHTMLTDNGTHLVGYTGSVDAPHVVFEVSLSDDGTGKFDFILRDALDHASGGNENNIVLGFTYTATDSDGDTATGTFSVLVNDDMPAAGTPTHGFVANHAETSLAGNLNVSFGADGPDTIVPLSLVGNVAPAGLTLDGVHGIKYFADDNGLIAYADMDNSGGLSPADAAVFALFIDPATSTYAFDLLAPLTQTWAVDGSTAVGSGANQAQELVSGVHQIALLSGSDAVNGSTTGWGVQNATFDAGESLRVDFTGQNSPNAVPGFEPSAPEFAFFTFDQYKSGDAISYTIHFADGFTSTGSFDPSVYASSPLELGNAGNLISSIDFNVTKGSGTIDLVSEATPLDVSKDLTFNVTVTDADHDKTVSQISIHVDGGTSLTGTAGEDVFGAAAGQTLTGGGGADHFRFESPSISNVHITDFTSGTDQIDVLLSAFGGSGTGALPAAELFQAAGGDNPASKVVGADQHFIYQQATGQLFYDANGGDSANRVLLAILDNHAAVTANDIHKV